jgi:hypothetical protein
MKKMAMAVLILVLGALSASAQDAAASLGSSGDYAKNCLYAEALGQGLLYSVNYEYMFTPHVSGRIGYTNWSVPMYLLISAGSLGYEGGPVMVNYLWGDGDHHLETGIGAVLGVMRYSGVDTIFGETLSDKYKFLPLGTATLGYRYQPREGGFLFKIGATPLFDGVRFLLTGGFAIGGTF